jgi:hypothetical protein
MTTTQQYGRVALVSRCREPDLEFKANGNIAVAPKKDFSGSYSSLMPQISSKDNIVQSFKMWFNLYIRGVLDTQSKTEPSRPKHDLRLVLNMITRKTNYYSSTQVKPQKT